MVEREGAAPGALQAGDAEAADGEVDAGEDLVEMVLAEHAERSAPADSAPRRLDGIVLGVLAGLGPGQAPLVTFPQSPRAEPVPARSTVTVDESAIGRDVALMFEGGDPERPILIGLINHPAPAVEAAAAAAPANLAVEVEADGQKVVVSAEQELVLRCGAASITLTRAGKILIRGAYVLTRSTGVNRIQGGSVQIN